MWIGRYPDSDVSQYFGRRRGQQGSPYFHICTAPRVFREHLKLLSSNGYKTIGLGEAVHRLEAGNGTTERKVVLTFDDGYGVDFYTECVSDFERIRVFGDGFSAYGLYRRSTSMRFNGKDMSHVESGSGT